MSDDDDFHCADLRLLIDMAGAVAIAVAAGSVLAAVVVALSGGFA